MHGKVALVTGGSRGIGRGIALALGRAGADVAVGYNQAADAAGEVVAELLVMGRRSVALQGDVGEPEVGERLVAETVAQLGQVDLAVANAGAATLMPFLETDAESYDRHNRVNARGSFLVAQAAARRMIEQGGGGRIVFVTSEGADRAVAGLAAYCSSKAAQKMTMKAAAVELAPYGITVNAVAPGTIETDANRHILADPENRKDFLGSVLLDRVATPDDVAGAVLYLAEAAHVTGATLSVNGGSVML